MILQRTTRALNILLGLCFILAVQQTRAESSADEKEEEKDARAEAERLKKVEEQALIRAQFPFRFSDIADRIVIINCESARGKSMGSGFLARMDGKTYLFTNQHVILGADKIHFTTADGRQLRPRRVELSMTRDIARLLVEDEPGFEICRDIKMDLPVGVFGNSEGAGVATELYGTVNGIGSDRIETSAEFVSGNSGSPMLNLDQEVLGIASYVRVSQKHAMKEGTEFENKTRRFCFRLTGNDWKQVNWKQYNDKYGKLYRQSETLANGIFGIIIEWGNAPLAKINVNNNPERTLNSWGKSHNEVISKYNRRGFKQHHFFTAYSESLKKLSDVCRDRSRQINMFANQRDLTGFLRDEFEKQAGSLNYMAEVIDDVSGKIYGHR